MKLTELHEAKYKQWKEGDVVRDRSGKVYTVDHQDDVKVFMKGQSSGHHHPNNLKAVDSEIVDAVKAVGTLDELPAAYGKIQDFMSREGYLKGMDEGSLEALIDKTKGQDKFALRVAMKVLGVREPN